MATGQENQLVHTTEKLHTEGICKPNPNSNTSLLFCFWVYQNIHWQTCHNFNET